MNFFSTPYGESKLEWCIACVPNADWAKKVFPNLSSSKAIEALWDAILNTVSVKGDKTSVDTWNIHNSNLKTRADKLNALNLKSLHFKSSNETDLTIGLVNDYVFEGGTSFTPEGIEFDANMPTEEIFTAPDRNSGNGIIVASMPLVHDGNVIKGIRFRVENGKIVEATADEGEDVLRAAITIDEGASYFGELALVPYDSPISNQKILYYSTLFDENAACHIAFGEAYPCIKGGADMSKEELAAHGLNDSLTHVDFMIGTPDMEIIGTTHDGREIPVFKNGNFAL